jgi:hypothetical protein
MSEETLSLGDIPDLTSFTDFSKADPFENGWYKGSIVEQRQFTDANGNDRVFASGDEPSQKTGRNIRLQVVLKRQSDGRELPISTIINYQPDDLSQATVQAVTAQMEKVKTGDQWGNLFRPFMVLNRLASLQRIAGVRQFERNGGGGLNLSPVYGKTVYARIKEDSRNSQYKEVAELRETAPKKAAVL